MGAANPVRRGKPGGRVRRMAEPVRDAMSRESRHFSGRRYTRAHEVLEELLRRPDLTRNQRFEALIRKAECLERMGMARSALDVLRAVTKSFPDEPLGWSLLGEYLFRIGEDSPGALQALGRALELSPDDPDSLWWRGQVFQSGLGNFKHAREAYQAALKADEKYGAAMGSLAELCEAQGNWIEAIGWRKSHFARDRKAADMTALAELYLRLGNFPAALKYARSAIHRLPRDAGAWLASAKAHAASGDTSGAALALGRYSSLAHPKSGPLIYSRDMAWLQSVLDRPGVARIVRKFLAQ